MGLEPSPQPRDVTDPGNPEVRRHRRLRARGPHRKEEHTQSHQVSGAAI